MSQHSLEPVRLLFAEPDNVETLVRNNMANFFTAEREQVPSKGLAALEAVLTLL